MSVRQIVTAGHPALRSKARELSLGELAQPETQALIDDLIDTMRDAHGAGLAATQIAEDARIAVIESVPTLRDEVVRLAEPLVSAPVPSTVEPCSKVTVSPSAGTPTLEVTAAVKVAAWP